MPLTPGTRLGPYEIVAPLGAGGMGEVYQGRDTRLDRTVAVKVIPAHLSATPAVRQRFEREARAVSALNHPNICTLYDVGEQDGVHFLVMELLQGETLQERLAKGPMPLTDALNCAIQIADALGRAHRQGVIHRDLKPGNIMLTKAGAKLLDFGLARSLDVGDPSLAGLTAAPTSASPLTAHGTIVGTFQYMAPELLEGAQADPRSDIFAFGLVLYEMLTGRRAFEGRTHASLVAAILKETPPPVASLNANVPPALDRLLTACLEKDPDERRQSIHDVLLDLRGIQADAVRGPVSASATVVSASGAARPAVARSGRAVWLGAAAVVALAAAAAGYGIGSRGGAPLTWSDPIAFDFQLGAGHRFRFDFAADNFIAPPALSPDGTRVVFGTTEANGRKALWIRELGEFEAKPIPGTEDGVIPFWSPDGRSIAFASAGKLRKIALAGGTSVVLADAPGFRGGSWSESGTILFAPGTNTGLYTVSADGGAVTQVTSLQAGVPDLSHRWPLFLPDGDRFLYLIWSNSIAVRNETGGIYAGAISGGEPRRILEAAANPLLFERWLLFSQGRSLMAVPFDPSAVEVRGEIVGTGEEVQYDLSTGKSIFTISPGGTMAWMKFAPVVEASLVWLDRAGAELAAVGTKSHYGPFRLSRDGQRVAISRNDIQAGDRGLWLIDLARDLETKFTLEPSDEVKPVWSPDGRQVAYASDTKGPYNVFVKPADRSRGAEAPVDAKRDEQPLDWSPDGRHLLVSCTLEGSAFQSVLLLDLESRRTTEWLSREGNVSEARFSSRGDWVAYVSDESGRAEVYAAPFPGPGEHAQVSTRGGRQPRFRADGRELVYQSLEGTLMAVAIDAGPSFLAGAPVKLFTLPIDEQWDATSDHQRFLVTKADLSGESTPLKVATEWGARLRQAGAPRPGR